MNAGLIAGAAVSTLLLLKWQLKTQGYYAND